MNFTDITKRRNLAVVLAVLFLVCASFVVLADDSEAKFEEIKDGDDTSLADEVDDFHVSIVEVPETADIPVSGEYTLSESNYSGQVIIVESGATIKQTVDSVTLDGCSIYFKGAVAVENLNVTLTGSYMVVFDGIYLDLDSYFEDVTVVADGVEITGNPGAFTLAAVSGATDYNAKLSVSGMEYVFTDSNGTFAKADYDLNARTATVTLNGMYVDVIDYYFDFVFQGDFEKDVYTLTYSTGYVITDDVATDAVEKAKADSTYVYEVSYDNYTVKLDSVAVIAVLTSGVTLTVNEASDLTPAQSSAVGNRPVYTITLGDVHELGDGTATVTLPYTLKAGENGANVYVAYVAADGTVEELETTYESGFVTFKTTHFSDFAILYSNGGGSDWSEDSDDGNNIAFYAAFAIAIVLLIVAISPSIIAKKQ